MVVYFLYKWQAQIELRFISKSDNALRNKTWGKQLVLKDIFCFVFYINLRFDESSIWVPYRFKSLYVKALFQRVFPTHAAVHNTCPLWNI